MLYAPNLSSYPKSQEIDAFYPDNNLTLTLFQKTQVTTMDIQQEKHNDSIWWLFLETLSDEFINQTGFGIYAHITPLDVHRVYREFQQNKSPLNHFARDYVRSYV